MASPSPAPRSRFSAKFSLASGNQRAEAILGRALGEGADLVVMGGYGHSRLREMMLGGVTRHVLEHATVPVLFSH